MLGVPIMEEAEGAGSFCGVIAPVRDPFNRSATTSWLPDSGIGARSATRGR